MNVTGVGAILMITSLTCQVFNHWIAAFIEVAFHRGSARIDVQLRDTKNTYPQVSDLIVN